MALRPGRETLFPLGGMLARSRRGRERADEFRTPGRIPRLNRHARQLSERPARKYRNVRAAGGHSGADALRPLAVNQRASRTGQSTAPKSPGAFREGPDSRGANRSATHGRSARSCPRRAGLILSGPASRGIRPARSPAGLPSRILATGGRDSRLAGQSISIPPLTSIDSPTMCEAASLARKAITLATSSGFPALPCGI